MLLRFLVALVLAVSITFGQSSATRAAPLDFNAIPRPPVPADPMINGRHSALAGDEAEQAWPRFRARQARQLSNVRAQPYDLKTSFTASGGLVSDGAWMLEDTSRARMYRWTASGPLFGD